MCIFSFFRKIKIERNTKMKLIAYILIRHNVLQDVSNRSSKVGFHKAKKKEKKRAVEGGRIIFRPTVSVSIVSKIGVREKKRRWRIAIVRFHKLTGKSQLATCSLLSFYRK